MGAQLVDRLGDQRFLAGMGAGGQEHGPSGGQRPQPSQLGLVAGQGLAHLFQVQLRAGDAAELLQPIGGGRVLRQDQVKAPQQGAGRRRRPGPAVGALLRHPG